MRFYEYAEHRVNNRNRLIRSDDVFRAAVEKGNTSPLFRSVFWYTEDVVDYLKQNKSIASYRGVRGITSIPIDIDKKSNSDDYTLDKLRQYLAKLDELGVGADAYDIFFSGTGYHIFIDNNVFGFDASADLPRVVGLTLQAVGLIDDPAAIRGSQLIRMEHSLNEKSGLFKIPLTYEEATTLQASEILELAKAQRLDFVYEQKDGCFQLEKYVVHDQQLDDANVVLEKNGEFNSRYAVCIQTLWNQGPIEGNRNNAVLRIASHFKRQGIPQDSCLAALLHWNHTTKASLDDKVIRSKVAYIYHAPIRYGCSDDLLRKHCHRSCIFYKNKNVDTEPLLSVDDLDEALMEHVAMRERKDEFINLKNVFGLEHDCVLYPGELAVFQGDTGVNKTSIIQNIMLGYDMVNDTVNPTGMSTIYYGPELSPGIIQMRNYCIVSGYDENKVAAHFGNGLTRYRKALENIAVQAGSLSIPQIENLITDKQPQVLIIDYYEQVDHPSWDRNPSIAIAEIAKSLSAMAVKHNIIIIAISQVNRGSVKEGNVGVHSGFGSGAIEKTARKLFVIEGEQASPYRRISLVKANNDSTWKDVVIQRLDSWRFKRIK